MLDKVYTYIPVALIAFAILSHALTFLAQVLDDLHKDKPGWIDTVSSGLAKVVVFLNGVKAPKA
jgi:hypothetical protein